MANEEGDGPPAPDWRDNVLKDRREAAAARAEQALGNLRADAGNPLSTPLEVIEGGAWDSPSPVRTSFIESLDGAGSSVKNAFSSAADELSTSAAGEPDQIDVANDPDNAWKTSAGSIDARAVYRGW